MASFFPALRVLRLMFFFFMSTTLAVAAAGNDPPCVASQGKETCRAATGADGFSTTVRQRHDFSCGAAVLATLLIHHYRLPIDEESVFAEMFEQSAQDRVVAQGFSMLDMKRYLEGKGYDAAGYEVSLEKLADLGIPSIVLLSYDGYRHFVVVKGVSGSEVLVGDPATGLRAIPRQEFDELWNGMILVLRDQMEVGRQHFNLAAEWAAAARSSSAAFH